MTLRRLALLLVWFGLFCLVADQLGSNRRGDMEGVEDEAGPTAISTPEAPGSSVPERRSKTHEDGATDLTSASPSTTGGTARTDGDDQKEARNAGRRAGPALDLGAVLRRREDLGTEAYVRLVAPGADDLGVIGPASVWDRNDLLVCGWVPPHLRAGQSRWGEEGELHHTDDLARFGLTLETLCESDRRAILNEFGYTLASPNRTRWVFYRQLDPSIEAVEVPVIASGGAGELGHLYQAFTDGKADAVLAASIFHFGTYSIAQAKDYLAGRGIPVRPLPGALV